MNAGSMRRAEDVVSALARWIAIERQAEADDGDTQVTTRAARNEAQHDLVVALYALSRRL